MRTIIDVPSDDAAEFAPKPGVNLGDLPAHLMTICGPQPVNLGGLTMPGDKRVVDLVDAIGSQGVARLSGADMLKRALSRYDDPDLQFLSAEFMGKWSGETICIHGSGPSIEQTLPELLELVANGAKICAVNAAHDWLIAKGIVPHFGIMADPKPWCADYQTPQPGTVYLIASACHDDVFARFKGHPRLLVWHALSGETPQIILDIATALSAKARETGRGGYVNTGGSTTMMRAVDAFAFLGFHYHDLFGCDSSGVREGDVTRMHGHAKPHVARQMPRPIYVKDPKNGRTIAHEFWSNSPMEHQAIQWEMILRDRFEKMRDGTYPRTKITVHGEGLWPASAAMYGLHHDPTYADRLRAEGYLEEPEPPPPPPMLDLNSFLQSPEFKK